MKVIYAKLSVVGMDLALMQNAYKIDLVVGYLTYIYNPQIQ